MKNGMVILDTLNLNIRYPHSDVFKNWMRYAEGIFKHVLRKGISVGDFVLRTGGSGYPISIWQHDARVFLTDETDEKRGEDQGMGIQVQLGPTYLIEHLKELNEAVDDLLGQIGVQGNWQTNITRLDLAVDVFNHNLAEMSLDDWLSNWVGWSKISKVFFSSQTSEIETINIGSRKSAIFLRIYDKTAQAIAEGDLVYWLDVWQADGLENVTRIEWEIKPKRGNFPEEITDFDKFSELSRKELLNYLVLWGRLTVPGEDQNKSRWQNAPFWNRVDGIIKEWADGVTWPISRYGKEFQGISEMYIKQLAGNISGGLARMGGDDQELDKMLDAMTEYGEGLERMRLKAKVKANVLKKL